MFRMQFLKELFHKLKPELGSEAFGRTDTGRVRKNNEDSFCILLDRDLYLVADGMGGHNAGEKASRLAIETLVADCSKESVKSMRGNREEIRHFFIRSFYNANQEVMRAAQDDPLSSGMGSTLVAAFIERELLHTCHVGDSRCYVVNLDTIRQITTDHSARISAKPWADGDMISGRAEETPQGRQVITCAIGFPFPEDPECHEIPLRRGDRVLLCSDGLWSMIDDTTIHQTLLASPTPEVACDELVRKANAAGGRDNITAVAVYISR